MMRKVGAVVLEIVLIFSCVFMPITNVKADEVKEWIICDESVPFENETLQVINTMSVKKSVIINGEKNYLYPTFDNKETAISNVKTAAEHVLSELAVTYGLDELSVENWESYYEVVNSYNNNDYQNEKMILLCFFSMYAGDDDNQSILNCLANANTLEEVQEELFYTLPYTTPYFNELSSMRTSQRSTRSTFIVSYAIRYARDYAYSPNASYVYFGENGDCTNFTSQIMLAGGMEMDGSGWYYQSQPTMYSNAWSVANNFARYWGVNYSTTSHYNFSKYLQAGDFIMLDYDGNAHWDHAGFVIQSDSYQTDGYFDYLVAQHSGNYIAWATSDTNGWDTLQDGKNTYGVIRK